MNIYVLKRKDITGHVEFVGFVVAALSWQHARRIASVQAGTDADPAAWLDAARVSCEVVGEAKPKLASQVILCCRPADFKAG